MTADISTDLTGWSTTASSNQPDYSDSVGPNNLADNLRALQAGVRYLISYGTIASATTTDLNTVKEAAISVTGTTTITALGTVPAGVFKTLVFSGALTFTHNATSLILPTGASITTAAGDCATMLSLGSGNWRCVSYMRASGAALTSVSTFGDGSVSSPSIAFTSDTNTGLYRIGADNLGITANGAKVVDVSTSGVSVTGTITASTSVTAGTTFEASASGYRMASGAHSLSYGTESSLFGGTSKTGLLFGVSSASKMLVDSNSHAYINGTFYSFGGGANFTSSGDNQLLISNGSSTPSAPISVTYTAFAGDTSRNALYMANTGGAFFRVRSDGAVFADGAYSGSGADFAEWFECDDPSVFRSGDAVTLEHGKARLAGPYDDPVGVVSTNPAVIGNHEQEGPRVLVGLVGQLWVNHGAPRGTRWKLMKSGDAADLYLVR